MEQQTDSQPTRILPTKEELKISLKPEYWETESDRMSLEDLWSNIGVCLMQHGFHDAAIAVWRAIVETNPTARIACFNLFSTYHYRLGSLFLSQALKAKWTDSEEAVMKKYGDMNDPSSKHPDKDLLPEWKKLYHQLYETPST